MAQGYEDGWDDLEARLTSIAGEASLNVYTAWYYGRHEEVLTGDKPKGRGNRSGALHSPTLARRRGVTMAGQWRTVLWGELATLEYGKSLRDYDSPMGDYKVYGTNGPIGWHSEPLCPFPSVVIGRKGAYRGVHYSPNPFFVIDTAFYLKPKVELDTRWAYYQLLTQDINGMDSGSAIPSTSREDFYGLLVDLPPLQEQQNIAYVLGTLDDKIELNRRMNETLEEMARALFKSWFVDFEPVRAKIDGRWRRGESLPGLPAEHYDLFPGPAGPVGTRGDTGGVGGEGVGGFRRSRHRQDPKHHTTRVLWRRRSLSTYPRHAWQNVCTQDRSNAFRSGGRVTIQKDVASWQRFDKLYSHSGLGCAESS